MNRTISQVVFKKKRRKRWGKKSGLQEKGMIYKEHLDSINYRQCTSRKAGSHPVRNWLVHLWRGEGRTSLLTQGGGCRMVAKCLVCFLEKTTSSHICSALWLVEKPLNLCHELISLRVFTTWLIGSFLWVLCAGLSPPGWLLNETESRAYTTQIEAHSWYLHDQTALPLHITLYTGV